MITPEEYKKGRAKVIYNFTEEEIIHINKIEAYVDSIIKSNYDSFEEYVDVHTSIFDFSWDPTIKKYTKFSKTSCLRMQKELIRRYKDAGWFIQHFTFGDTSRDPINIVRLSF